MRDRGVRVAILSVGIASLALFGACQHFHSSSDCPSDECGSVGCAPGTECHDHTKVCKNPTVHALACDLDHLEKHIDWFGSVVPKVPDVWGQARLTQHREEFEAQMAADLGGFKQTLNGALTRSDQAFFAHATSLSLAAQPKPRLGGGSPASAPVAAAPSTPLGVTLASQLGTVVDRVQQQQTVSAIAESAGKALTTADKLRNSGTAAPASSSPAKSSGSEKVELPDVTNPADLITKTDTIERTELKSGISDSIALEPTLQLAQKARYLNFLQQLRRTNEGADTADSPGYALNLMRIPVSILPGKRTDVGHGAEITFTLDPVLGDDLLPMTFRNMVVNDVSHQLGLPIAYAISNKDIRKLLTPKYQMFFRLCTRLNDKLRDCKPDHAQDIARAILCRDELAAFNEIARNNPEMKCALQNILGGNCAACSGEHCKSFVGDVVVDCSIPPAGIAMGAMGVKPPAGQTTKAVPLRTLQLSTGGGTGGTGGGAMGRGFPTNFIGPAFSFANGLENRTAVPTSQLYEVYGEQAIFEIAYGAFQSLAESTDRQKYPHLPDVQTFLKEELRAAYEFLRKHPQLFSSHCTQALVEAIRLRRTDDVLKLRQQYRTDVEDLTNSTLPTRPTDKDKYAEYLTEIRNKDPMHLTVTASMGWALIVNAAMLNDRLVQDMRESATSKNKPCPIPPDAWPEFFQPTPTEEAREQFKQYVRIRWPIYVFALDPVTEDQNIADALSVRRETQLALAIAFTNGTINANTLTKYTRRLEADYETIALNRTQVGFAHGENTFGWRFYPRFQSPETRSNITTLVRDQLVGGPNRNQLLRERRLEPGQRDCVALVIMPSFVPCVTVDSVSNWFGLANPKHKSLDHTQAVKMSKTVKTLQSCEHAITDAECYRDGELPRLQKRVEQLANRLPTQTLSFPVPILNTLGGFEMFSNGTTDLAPELYGWYGAPGVAADKDTTLFLVGDHFSPLRTRTIVGNAQITSSSDYPLADATKGINQRLLSRQVMQITIPKGTAIPFKDPKDNQMYVQAHIATPYGVSRDLRIPFFKTAGEDPPKVEKEGYSLSPTKVAIRYQLLPDGKGKYLLAAKSVSPQKLVVKYADALGTGPVKVQLRFVVNFQGTNNTIPCNTQDLLFDESEGGYVLEYANLLLVANDLIALLNTKGPFDPSSVPFDQVKKTVAIEVIPVDPNRVAQKVTLSDQLELEFTGSIDFCPAPVPQMVPPAPENGAGGKPSTAFALPLPRSTVTPPVAASPPVAVPLTPR